RDELIVVMALTFSGFKNAQMIFLNIKYPFKLAAHPNWPSKGNCFHLKMGFQLCEQVKRFLNLAVQFVYKRDDWRVACPTYFKQALSLWFYPIGSVNYH